MKHIERGVDRRKSSGSRVAVERRKQPDRRKNAFISDQGFFRNVPYQLVEPLLDLCRIDQLKPGDILLKPQVPNQRLFLVLEGKLKVHIGSVDAEEGFDIEPGEFIGELSVIDGELPSAFVVAKEECRILAIPDTVLWEHFFKNPDVARNFIQLFARRLRNRNQVIQEALEHRLRLEHLQKELAIARDIQASMLPSDTDFIQHLASVDIRGSMMAASEVGGDFYDIFRLDDEHIYLSIGDVSGKGIPAALFMVKSQTVLREEVLKGGDLVAAVQNTNVKLCQDNDSCMFATLVTGILNVETGLFTYINAGHNEPLLGRGGETFNYLKSARDILVGINELANYTASQLQLQRDDVLVLYTDGVTEAMNPAHEVYSDEKLRDLLTDRHLESAEHTISTIVTSVKAFAEGAPQSDDLTLLVIRFRGSNQVAVAGH